MFSILLKVLPIVISAILAVERAFHKGPEKLIKATEIILGTLEKLGISKATLDRPAVSDKLVIFINSAIALANEIAKSEPAIVNADRDRDLTA